MADKKIDIILLSFNDPRILKAIESVRHFDDVSVVRLIVVDGGSAASLVEGIKSVLSSADILVVEKDDGIFDALNKGIKLSGSEFLGWLGSDDYFSPMLKASFILKALCDCDVLIGDTVHFKSGIITRKSYSLPSKMGLYRYGFNNPHFSTFGRSTIFKAAQFSLNLRSADILYFLTVFNTGCVVSTLPSVFTYMEDGGYSNSSVKAILLTNFELYGVYRRFYGPIHSLSAIILKLIYKISVRIWFYLKKEKLD